MKRLQVLFLVALSSSLLLFGCGKSEETAVQPIVQPIVEQQPEKEEDSSSEEAETEEDLDTPPAEGMVRSRLTNEWVDEDVANTRPVAIMIPNSKTASQYSISDIEIGKVTVLGIYRGEFDRRDVERKINRMMALNDSGKKNQQETNDIQDSGMDIEDGVREEDKNGIRNISLAQGKVHYIDVIAIIQDINI